MATFQMVPVKALVEPLNPQRQETLLENIDSLRDSIREKGLEQPIGVRDLGDGTYRIIWGHRRSIAITQLGWEYAAAMVYGALEGNDDELMGAENYHRNKPSDAEEALYYKRVVQQEPEGTIGLARRLNVPQGRIESLLLLADGDPRVFDLMRTDNLPISTALEINKFQSEGYRLQAIERWKVDRIGADTMRRWRKDLQRQGIDQVAVDETVRWAEKVQATGQVPEDICNIGNHSVPLNFRKVYSICNEHYNIFLEGLEALGRERVIKEAGLGRDLARLVKIAEGEGGTPSESVRSANTT